MRKPAALGAGLAILSIAFASIAAGAGVARATPPGQNGLISYREYFDPGHSTGAVFVVNPDGTDRRQITFPGAGNLE